MKMLALIKVSGAIQRISLGHLIKSSHCVNKGPWSQPVRAVHGYDIISANAQVMMLSLHYQ